jgi:7-carboxy-7-deazaguanine synthase
VARFAPILHLFPAVAETLVVNEIYLSLQGESTFAGLPCVFIRLTACDLRCSYCDTAYAFGEGKRRSLTEIMTEVERLGRPFASATHSTLAASRQRLPLVELTGGEPLLQPQTPTLMKQLCDAGYTVLLETSGAHDIGVVDERVHRIVDVKCPSSGEADRNRWENLPLLRPNDEVKFVIASVEDYEWSKKVLPRLADRCPILFSWAAPLSDQQRDPSLKPFPASHTALSRRELAERIIADALPVRFQAQLHKVIWAPDQRGV